jgi:hypothetical protein
MIPPKLSIFLTAGIQSKAAIIEEIKEDFLKCNKY